MSLRFVSLCSGVGLLDLGLEWAGHTTVQLCELDPYASATLEHRFPGVPIHGDVWTIEPEECDAIAAGFPCQPFSVAGRQLGDKDPRHLWPAIIRSIRMARPRYVLLENVPGLVTWGLGEVLGDLATAGFDAEWTCFNASDVGAPHKRRRWWCVATSDPDSSRLWDADGGFFREAWATSAIAWTHGETRSLADTDSVGRERRAGAQRAGRRYEPTDSSRRDVPHADSSTIQPRRIGWGAGEASRPGWWATEPYVGRVAHGVPSRVDRLRCLGNGVVPQCAELIGLRIRQLEGLKCN